MKLRNVLKMLAAFLLLAISVSAVEKGENFVFGKADLELLKEVDLLDQRYERDALVYHDDAINDYVTRIAVRGASDGFSARLTT